MTSLFVLLPRLLHELSAHVQDDLRLGMLLWGIAVEICAHPGLQIWCKILFPCAPAVRVNTKKGFQVPEDHEKASTSAKTLNNMHILHGLHKPGYESCAISECLKRYYKDSILTTYCSQVLPSLLLACFPTLTSRSSTPNQPTIKTGW